MDWLGDEMMGSGDFYMPWLAVWSCVWVVLLGQGQDIPNGSYFVKVLGIHEPMPLNVTDEVDSMLDWNNITIAI